MFPYYEQFLITHIESLDYLTCYTEKNIVA